MVLVQILRCRSIPNMYMNFFSKKNRKKIGPNDQQIPDFKALLPSKAGANIERFFIHNKMFPKKNSIKNQPIEIQFVTAQKR